MKIVLARPVRPSSTALNVMPPIGLGYLARVIRKGNLGEVQILDCLRDNYDITKFLEYIKRYSPDIVGFQVFSHDVPMVNKSIEVIRAIKKEITVVIGGPHPSGVGGECLQHIEGADFAFKGEAEVGFPKLIKILKEKDKSMVDAEMLNNVPGLIWRGEDGRIMINPQCYLDDLDSIGFPTWDLMDPNSYPDAPQGLIFRHLPIAPVMITRGCPYQCTFCAGNTISGYKVRHRSIDNVMGEIELLFTRYGIRELHILDDNFTIDKNYVQQFCQEILKRKFNLSWCCPNGVRLDTLDKETLIWMKNSGCYYISVGIESGSDRILALMKKNLRVGQIEQKVNLVKEAGLSVNAFFIVGYPGETEEDILQTIHFARSLPLQRAAFYSFLPLPGTEVYQQLVESGELNKLDWGRMFQSMHPYCPSGISEKELVNLFHKAYRDFYFRPHILFALLREIRTLNQLKFIMRRFMVYLLGMEKWGV